MATEKRQPLSVVKASNRHVAESTRARIKLSKLVDRVQDCAMGKAEMSTQELRAAEMLINKCIPNISHHETEVNVNNNYSISNETSQAIKNLLNTANNRIEKVINEQPTVIDI